MTEKGANSRRWRNILFTNASSSTKRASNQGKSNRLCHMQRAFEVHFTHGILILFYAEKYNRDGGVKQQKGGARIHSMWARPDEESTCRERWVSADECRLRKYYEADLARASAAKTRNGGSSLEARPISDFLLATFLTNQTRY